MAVTKIWFCWITTHDDRTEHAVTDDRQPRAGVFEGVCGVGFLAASMDLGPDRRCPSCAAFIRARNTIRDLDERMTHKRHSRGRHAA